MLVVVVGAAGADSWRWNGMAMASVVLHNRDLLVVDRDGNVV